MIRGISVVRARLHDVQVQVPDVSSRHADASRDIGDVVLHVAVSSPDVADVGLVLPD
jgi:hypothetical protein